MQVLPLYVGCIVLWGGGKGPAIIHQKTAHLILLGRPALGEDDTGVWLLIFMTHRIKTKTGELTEEFPTFCNKFINLSPEEMSPSGST